ncbi:hypothetical protein COX86_01605 [Candidatus Micrarchaeota archaeon CG_4_10_14_0_2_um_filter_60_11]|nr:MAG: hypothetical protein AUJ16_02040 [Candidatus Micrarchaeota archaeon CG1_02_60_51]PIN96529.1 MAG: hypothetical protein COU39_01025 [Candidatus Micrarchaeota archaeon CG10_big_fil_rev_8_21_14_0_10_60_32]PIO02255.1 MAG: hypothetical protein COT58_01135 [Candidatus Micrarchaeota archaeon CG09_land_8_20_14_0_10_60_16]PIY91813.1 MAG: hypothetical protein COY71_01155 [Candidatus Micrarchaeota archaeon CG_4_10_14_0_8_um_filter_60_7]PIZ91076.1 MAG: hypothetical protein COX86_01605 [Candidatus Mi
MRKLKPVTDLLDSLIDDSAVPRNVRLTLADAKKKLTEGDDPVAGMSGAIYDLDAVSNDINLPMHARTLIWNLLSELESLKEEQIKK